MLSDLPDETVYPAQDLLDTCLPRRGIEQMFQKVSEVFCLVIYNAIQMRRSYVSLT